MHLGPTVVADDDEADGDRRRASTGRTSRVAARSVDRRRVALALGLGGASAMTLELSAGDWAAFRLGDDLGTSGQLAAAGFVAFTIGMTSGRLGGDAVQLRIGVERLLVLASVLAGFGLAVAEFAPLDAVVLAGFLVAGLGVSVLFPQLYDAAARAPGPPGSGFTSMLIGQRTAALLTPLAIGALAGTSALGVGDAMAIVSLPAAALSLALAIERRRRAAAV
jgi:fucose permease